MMHGLGPDGLIWFGRLDDFTAYHVLLFYSLCFCYAHDAWLSCASLTALQKTHQF